MECIPVTKMHQVPARAMDINQSTVKGNIEALEDLADQAGVGDPNDVDNIANWEKDVLDMSEYVVLIHGDLGTMERVQSLLERRANERTPCRRLQYVVFVMGLFHLKMAAADALWRIFLRPIPGREDECSLMRFVTQLRPRETGKMGSGPGFRRMHETILHAGTVLRLDCWRVEVKRRNPALTSLDLFAETKPSMEQIEAMSNELAKQYVAGGNVQMHKLRRAQRAARDQQHENILLMHQYFLLYEELSWAMNAGDIGRVETLFPAWIYLFKATGKHKYATQMERFLTDVHFVYPEGLR